MTTEKTPIEIAINALEGVVGYWTTSNDCLPSKEQALEALAALRAHKEVGNGWQPIETAPRDGTHILAHYVHNNGLGYSIVVYWDGEFWSTITRGLYGSDRVGHWQPLPSAPGQTPPPAQGDMQKLIDLFDEALDDLQLLYERGKVTEGLHPYHSFKNINWEIRAALGCQEAIEHVSSYAELGGKDE